MSEDVPSNRASEFCCWGQPREDRSLRTFKVSLAHFYELVATFHEDLPSHPSRFRSDVLFPLSEDTSSPSSCPVSIAQDTTTNNLSSKSKTLEFQAEVNTSAHQRMRTDSKLTTGKHPPRKNSPKRRVNESPAASRCQQFYSMVDACQRSKDAHVAQRLREAGALELAQREARKVYDAETWGDPTQIFIRTPQGLIRRQSTTGVSLRDGGDP